MIIRTDTPFEYNVLENDTEKSVIQNVTLIVSTKLGTVPGYREFGMPFEGLDKPIDVAQTLLTAEIYDAVEKFEPRCVINSIEFEGRTDGRLTAIMEVSLK